MSRPRTLPTSTRLLASLKAAGITKGDLARETGLSWRSVQRHLDGLRRTPQAMASRQRIEDAARSLLEETSTSFPSNPWGPQHPDLARKAAHPPGDRMPTPSPRLVSFDALQHLNLDQDPFEDAPGMRLHIGPRLKHNRAALVRAIQMKKMVALVANPGGGKSTLLRLLHTQIHKNNVRVLWITPGNLSRRTITESSLAAAILRDLGQEVPNAAEERGEALRKELERRALGGELVCLVIDEGQDLVAAGLIAVKRIWDSFRFDRSLAVIIAGQLPLLRMLEQDPSVEEVAGRMLKLIIPPMSEPEIRGYVNHRCSQVNGDGQKLFTDSAISAIARQRGTAPLWINAICQDAIEATHQLGLEAVNHEAVLHGRKLNQLLA